MAHDPITALTRLAVEWTNNPPVIPPQLLGLELHHEPILNRLTQLATEAAVAAGDDFYEEARAALSADEDLEVLRQSDPGVMVLHPEGGSRLSIDDLPAELLASALSMRLLMRLDDDPATLASLLLEGLTELKRGLRGEPVRLYRFRGYSGVSLADGVEIMTPWGRVLPAPVLARSEWPLLRFGHPRTEVLLVATELVGVKFDPANEPSHETDLSYFESVGRAGRLMPLACVLGCDPDQLAAPVAEWSTVRLPFKAGGGFSWNPLGTRVGSSVDLSSRTREIAEWARIVDAAHDDRIDIAGQKTVSAVSLRTSRGDALIDAVTAWVNLVGTESETTFRVTGALACLLESGIEERLALRRRLANVYEVRSRLVHGETVDPSRIEDAATTAAQVAVNALRASYQRGGSWLTLKSTERADRLLLA